MNAKAHRTDTLITKAEYEQRIESIRRDILADIMLETLRIHRTGRTVSAALHPEFVTIYVHEGTACTDHSATLNDTDSLIDLLEKLENVTDPIYDLDEEVCEDGEL
ncbi:MAG: hypothetical protein IJX39_04900 [Clostridia bacterium]|nr:hypothetical protein [Clostridia bacterium]